MNKDAFFEYVERDRGADPARLDAAVRKGLSKAKSRGPDFRNLAALAAACAFTAAACFAANLEPFEAAAEARCRNWNSSMPGAAEALAGHVKNMADNAKILAAYPRPGEFR